MDEQALDALVSYCIRAVHTCSTWTHPEVLLALSSVLYANGAKCQRVRGIQSVFESLSLYMDVILGCVFFYGRSDLIA